MQSANVIDNIKSNQLVTPQTESQARPLTRLPPEKQVEVWDEVVRTAAGGTIIEWLI